MGKSNNKNLGRLEVLIAKLIKGHSKYSSRNFPIENKTNQLKFY